MKEHKVGDMIYAKGTVGRTDDTRNPCYVEFGYGVEGWIPRDNIADELLTAEPTKSTLPEKVANEMEKAKETNKFFDLYIQRVIGNNPDFYPHSSKYWYNHDGNNTETLLNAWNNGYTVEKEKKYNLILGFNTYYKERATLYKVGIHGFTISIDTETTDDSLKHDDSYQFTQEEIDRYNENLWIKNLDLNKLKVEVKN